MLAGFVVVWLLLSGWAAAHAVLHKRDPRSATIWVFVCFTLPLIGPWFYWGFGINRVQRQAVKHLGRRKRAFDLPHLVDAHRSIDEHPDAVGHLRSLRTVADRVTRMPMLAGNKIVPLHNGEQAYPRMLLAIREAERSVTLASYIFDWDEVGREFGQALAEAARRGVHVHVLVDGLGALGSFSRMGRLMLKSGVRVAAFFPLRFPFGRVRLNLRNHRKLLMVDGRIGFTGGMNISQRHLLHAPGPARVEDLHFEITGPVVSEMQHAFGEDWALVTDEVLEGEGYYPNLASTGPALCRGLSSGPDDDFEKTRWILLAAFASAARSVRIVTPYFIPSGGLVSAMAMASLRGVSITLLLPSVVDHTYMRWAADAYLWQLLRMGVRVVRRRPPFVHTKLLIVDDRWVLLGSANLDPRSLRLNFEFNVEAYDTALAGSLCTWLDELAAKGDEVTLDEVDARPTWQRLRDGVVKMASPFL